MQRGKKSTERGHILVLVLVTPAGTRRCTLKVERRRRRGSLLDVLEFHTDQRDQRREQLDDLPSKEDQLAAAW